MTPFDGYHPNSLGLAEHEVMGDEEAHGDMESIHINNNFHLLNPYYDLLHAVTTLSSQSTTTGQTGNFP